MMMNSGLYTYGLNGVWKGDEHPAYAPLDYGHPLPLPLYDTDKVTEKQQILMYKAQFTWQCYRLSYCEIIRKGLIHKDKINAL